MSPPVRRGSVVSYGRHVGVVWDPRPESFTIFPVYAGFPHRSTDVGVESLGDHLLMRLRRPGHVRVEPIKTAVEQEYLGEASGDLMCRLSLAVIRAVSDAMLEARWGAERRHREMAADEKCAV